MFCIDSFTNRLPIAFMQLRYVDDGGKTRLSTVLAQSSDGKAVLNHTLLSKLEFKEKETPLLSLEYEDQLGRIGIMNLTVGQVELPVRYFPFCVL